MTSEIVLIRHGETDWNVEERYQGSSDRPLNERGIRQSEALAESMKDEMWNAIIASPLQRAWNTALPIVKALGMSEAELIPDPRLMERSFGIAEGFSYVERPEHLSGEVWEGLESDEEINARAFGALDEYAQRFSNQRLILVTHGNWIKSVLETISQGVHGHGKSIILNTSRTFLIYSHNGWEIGEIAAADHLGALV